MSGVEHDPMMWTDWVVLTEVVLMLAAGIYVLLRLWRERRRP